MRRLAVAFGLAFALISQSAQANLLVEIDKSRQRMTVVVDGTPRYSWPVSTGRSGFGTPSGVFHPQRLARVWFSRKYYNSPMPHSIFFHGGFAIHGSYEIHRLGGPASHGCVRLHPGNAAVLYALVQQQGTGATRIVVSGATHVATAPRAQPGAYRWVEEPRAYYQPYRPRYYYYGGYGYGWR